MIQLIDEGREEEKLDRIFMNAVCCVNDRTISFSCNENIPPKKSSLFVSCLLDEAYFSIVSMYS